MTMKFRKEFFGLGILLSLFSCKKPSESCAELYDKYMECEQETGKSAESLKSEHVSQSVYVKKCQSRVSQHPLECLTRKPCEDFMNCLKKWEDRSEKGDFRFYMDIRKKTDPPEGRVTAAQLCRHVFEIMEKEVGDIGHLPEDVQKRQKAEKTDFILLCIEGAEKEKKKLGPDLFEKKALCFMKAKNGEELTACSD